MPHHAERKTQSRTLAGSGCAQGTVERSAALINADYQSLHNLWPITFQRSKDRHGSTQAHLSLTDKPKKRELNERGTGHEGWLD